jgi:predicted TPR repeat methyltransferase
MSSPVPLFLTSGDLTADRRYAYAQDFLARGDLDAAADLLAQAVERAPGFASAWFALGETRARLGDRCGAVEAFRRARAADAEDRIGAGLRLAQLGAEDLAAAMSPGYVRAIFDQYAPDFDRALVQGLCYRGPQLLLDAVLAACTQAGRPPHFDRAFDLGCGTGLVGELFWGRIDSLVGVDLSPQMVALAERKGCYNHLHIADMLDFLRVEPIDSTDLIVAADALVYVADLAPLFVEIARVMEQGGLFAFTVETHEGEGVVLGEKLRYAHADPYVRTVLNAAGLAPVAFGAASTRTEAGVAVPGLLVVAEQRNRPPVWSDD